MSPAEPLPAASDTTPKAIPRRMGYRAASDTEERVGLAHQAPAQMWQRGDRSVHGASGELAG